MPLAPQPRRRTDAPRAVSPRGVGLSAQSQHLALACGRRRCVSTPQGPADAGTADAHQCAHAQGPAQGGGQAERTSGQGVSRPRPVAHLRLYSNG